MAKLFKNYVALFIFSGFLLVTGVLTLPPLRLPVIKLILAIGLFLYLALFLFKKLREARSVMFLVLLIEFVIISLIAAGLVFSQFELIKIDGVCRITGLSLWIHATGAMIGEYHAALTRAKRTPLYVFALHIALLSFGAYTFAAPFVSDKTISWIASALSFALAVLFLIFAIIFASARKKITA